jgi:hypothetical protein
MFEIGIFCVVFPAVAYWTVLWPMGCREDDQAVSTRAEITGPAQRSSTA